MYNGIIKCISELFILLHGYTFPKNLPHESNEFNELYCNSSRFLSEVQSNPTYGLPEHQCPSSRGSVKWPCSPHSPSFPRMACPRENGGGNPEVTNNSSSFRTRRHRSRSGDSSLHRRSGPPGGSRGDACVAPARQFAKRDGRSPQDFTEKGGSGFILCIRRAGAFSGRRTESVEHGLDPGRHRESQIAAGDDRVTSTVQGDQLGLTSLGRGVHRLRVAQ